MLQRPKLPRSISLVTVLLAALLLSACSPAKIETPPTLLATPVAIQSAAATSIPIPTAIPTATATSLPALTAIHTPPAVQAADIMHKPLVTDIYTADPSAHVFEGKLYIYPSHDLDHDTPPSQNGDQYDMEDYHVFSMDNLQSWPVDHGQVLHVKDVPWATKQMWAPDAAFKNGQYYLYFPARDKDNLFRIGVATSPSPAGPFTPQAEFITGSFSIDPAVFVGDDGQAYMYFGGLWGGQLEKWQTEQFDPNGVEPADGQPALGPRVAKLSADMLSFDGPAQEVSIVDEQGQPVLADDHMRRFFEASWMHKYNGTYYLSYSTGDTHYLAYATSPSPTGPFTFRGYVLKPVKGWTTHHSIVEFQGKWYLFYHDDQLSGVDHKRNIKVAELNYNADGSIKTIKP
jgi:beta-xylosidase